jgi:hypothetical protein
LHGTIKARNLREWIPVQFPTSEFRDLVSTHDLRESVGQIEALVKRDGHLVFGFTPEQQQLLQTLFQFETEFTQSIRNWVAQSARNAGPGDSGLTTAEREESPD